jgi:hypothetical protein
MVAFEKDFASMVIAALRQSHHSGNEYLSGG